MSHVERSHVSHTHMDEYRGHYYSGRTGGSRESSAVRSSRKSSGATLPWRHFCSPCAQVGATTYCLDSFVKRTATHCNALQYTATYLRRDEGHVYMHMQYRCICIYTLCSCMFFFSTKLVRLPGLCRIEFCCGDRGLVSNIQSIIFKN